MAQSRPGGPRGSQLRVLPASYGGTEYGNLSANLELIARSGGLEPDCKVLEIGSGKGRLLHEFRARGLDVVGVELNPRLIAAGRQAFGRMPIVRGTAVQLCLRDASFDVVLEFDVFEHIADTERHVDEVWRVLRPGGRYLLTTPNKWTNIAFEVIIQRSFTRWKAYHCALHSRNELRRRLTRHGFEVTFHDVPLVNEWFLRKVRAFFGRAGVAVVRILSPDRGPAALRTNFCVEARKAVPSR
ncbi:MAG: class I SAM-dependent methyltransferase [Gemmatimonadetes bacterium]|nr:class I SAM-dependent methyltransferase [Gemmatimonadota bacterium]